MSDEDIGFLCDWVGVGEMTPLRDRVLYLCAEFLSRTGQVGSIEEALVLGRNVLEARAAGPMTDEKHRAVSAYQRFIRERGAARG